MTTPSQDCQEHPLTKNIGSSQPNIEGDVLLTGAGTLSNLSVTGRWIQVLERSADNMKLPIIQRNRLSGLERVDLCALALDSELKVRGDLYMHPNACLVLDRCSCSQYNLYCLDDDISDDLRSL